MMFQNTGILTTQLSEPLLTQIATIYHSLHIAP